MSGFASVFQVIPANLAHPAPGSSPLVALALSPLEIGAGLILLIALAALVAAVAAAARQPGGLSAIFGGHRHAPSESPARETADELRDLIAEARKLSDELADRFDGRASDMARLLREADLRVARLEQVLRAESGPVSRPPAIEHDAPRPPVRSAGMVEPVHIAPVGDPMAREIYQLSDEGLPPVEIARRLGQHTGKVELILALRRG